MKRTAGWLVVCAVITWTMPASADVANDDCGTKEVGDACEDYSGATGVCIDDDGAIVCDVSDEPEKDAGGGSGGSAGSKDADDDDGGCAVRNAGAAGRGEAVALGLLLLVCVALRKRFD